MDNSISKIKQPAPSISSGVVDTVDSQGKNYKIINGPNVGVIQLPKISTTPIRDMIEIKRKENPYTVYKFTNNKYSIKGFQTTASLLVLLCGLLSGAKIFKK